MEDKHPIDENKLDELLKAYTLDKKVNAPDEQLAEAAMSKEYNIPIDRRKEEEMLKKLYRSTGGGGYKPVIYGGLVVLMIVALAFYFAASKAGSRPSDLAKYDSIKSVNDVSLAMETGKMNPDQKEGLSIIHNPTLDTFGKITRLRAIVYNDTLSNQVIKSSEGTTPPAANNLPYISEKDKVKYEHIKKQMLEKLYKQDKALYTHVEANELNYAGKPTIIEAFTIRNIAITNLEYKTFLADLLIKKRTEDYYKAEVLSLKWNAYGYEKLGYEYFQEEQYNDFPVVNISVEAGRIFAQWLEDELKQYTSENKLKQKTLYIHLPTDQQWMLAARDGYAKIAYDAGYNTIYEIKEGLVDFSFVKRLNQIKKKATSKDTLYGLYCTNRYTWQETQVKQFLSKSFGAFSYLPTDTIIPDRMKIYGKIGHVSEMVLQQNSSKVWLSGLTWKTKEEYQSFENKFKTDGVSPFVSFRIVVINSEDPVYKNPFW